MWGSGAGKAPFRAGAATGQGPSKVISWLQVSVSSSPNRIDNICYIKGLKEELKWLYLIKINGSGVPWWLIRFRIWHCYCFGLGGCCGVGSTPGLGISTCLGHGQKEGKKKEQPKQAQAGNWIGNKRKSSTPIPTKKKKKKWILRAISSHIRLTIPVSQ